MIGSNPDVDVGVMLGLMESDGLVARAQVEVLREGFREAQQKELETVLSQALKEGLLRSDGAVEARSEFEARLLSQSPQEHMVSSGRLTQAQAQRMKGNLTGGFAAVLGAANALGVGQALGSGDSSLRARKTDSCSVAWHSLGS